MDEVSTVFTGGLLSLFLAVVSTGMVFVLLRQEELLISVAVSLTIGVTVFMVLWFVTVLSTMEGAFNEFGL